MHTFVKISGITEPGLLSLVPEGGAAGFFIEVADSPRSLSVEGAAALVAALPQGAEAWAIVESPSPELIHRLFDEAGVDRIQVYGVVPAGLEFLEVHHLVPSLPVPLPGAPGPDPAVPPAEDYARLHLDAAGSPIRDGSLSLPDWEVCHRIVEAQPGRKLVLAGGLSVENVGRALAEVNPWGVDVCAGVERRPGFLELERVRAFLQAVEAYESAGRT